MERSNQTPEPECCRREGRADATREGSRAEQLAGGVHREIRGPQAGVAHRLSHSASKPLAAGGAAVQLAEPNTAGADTGEASVGLPGSKIVAREEQAIRNPGDPEFSRRTNCEDQAGRPVQRREGRAEATPGVGSLHSSSGQPCDSRGDRDKRGDRLTQPAQATSAVRTTGQSWGTGILTASLTLCATIPT